MCTLLTSKSLSLLLLLLKVVILQEVSEEWQEEFEDYMDEIHTKGPIKPPTKKCFQKNVLEAAFEPFEDNLCTHEIAFKNIHTNLYCHREYHFLNIAFEELQKACYTKYVACENGVKKCHKTEKPIEGAYCNYTGGLKMPYCEYKTIRKTGYALITCLWQDDIGEIIPAYVNSILESPGK
ncbi:inactive ribonuclease-like protein 9 [Pipistrellus kuhlii]|uniref:Inactive ribonuclease-like protein 9 n=1 Tax=Pipistrellus kuhlii TaxID=59472 RepID=A0A7J8B4A5_PIPKU|nr:inactive ribonuclease-like protein 9 [Pipistrellus kuhlii]XP_045431016.1 inactive ribonuclease-like protein 9 [Pipistrellus kuhlii]KAF6393548.1 ribonuclease A family member 9 (inactive) [Pipistrellus kuhlii]